MHAGHDDPSMHLPTPHVRTLVGDLGLRALLLLLLLAWVRRRLLLPYTDTYVGYNNGGRSVHENHGKWRDQVRPPRPAPLSRAFVPLASSEGKTGGQPYVSISVLSLLAAA